MGDGRRHRMVPSGCAALGIVAPAACPTSVPGAGTHADPVTQATSQAAPGSVLQTLDNGFDG